MGIRFADDDWLTPFFFIGIGLQLNLSSLTAGLTAGAVCLVAATIGKLIGAGLPAWWQLGAGAGALMGGSMIPRAEIGRIVVQTGSKLGTWAVSDSLYAGMVFVSARTCIAAPTILRFLFAKIPGARHA